MKKQSPRDWVVPLIFIPLLAVVASFAVRVAVSAPTLMSETAVVTPSSASNNATPLPTITPTPAPGLSRQTALPLQEVNRLTHWEFSVLEQIRGAKAEELILDTNMFNQPAPEGYEYLLLRMRVQNKRLLSDEERLSFALTGDQQRVYYNFSYSVVEPEPQLETYLSSGATSEGWIEFVVAKGEQELVLLVEDQSDYTEPLYFYMLSEGANPLYNFAPDTYTVSLAGASKESALSVGETAVSPNWQIHVGQILRGADAIQFLDEIDGYTPDQERGLEYLFAYVELRYIGPPFADPEGDYTTDDIFAVDIDGSIYDVSYADFENYAFPPTSLYPEGMVNGWISFEIPQQAKGHIVFWGDGYRPIVEDVRYWQIEE